MALAVRTCLMACHRHVCRLSGREKRSVFNPRGNQEHSLKPAPYLLLVLSLMSDLLLFSVCRRHRGSPREASSSRPSREAEARPTVSEGSYLSTRHWLLTYLTAGPYNDPVRCPRWNLKHARTMFTRGNETLIQQLPTLFSMF